MKAKKRMRFLRGVGLAHYEFLEKASQDGEMLYGVRITLQTGHGEEQAECYVTADRAAGEAFFARVERGSVTPCTLAEIADDQVF